MKESNLVNELTDMYQKKIFALVKRLNIRTKFAKLYKKKNVDNAEIYKSSMEHAELEHKALKVQYGAINKTLDFMIAKGKTKDAEIERLKGYNDEALKVLKKERSEAEATITSREADIELLNANHNEMCDMADASGKKYDRLVACLLKYSNRGALTARDILETHRANEKKLKEKRGKKDER